jgi:hypothetical protein
MSEWPKLLRKPTDLDDGAIADAWFVHIAEELLNGARLVVGGQRHRLTEIEFYWIGPEHPDPFTHRDPIQLQNGRWYFHRTNGVYRSGSFKGLDLAFGDGTSFGGVLIRGLETPNDELVDGPSLLVDHLLDGTGAASVPALDKAIGTRVAWENDNPLRLEQIDDEERPLFRSARVGLTLKKSRSSPEPQRFVLRPYRFFSEPLRIAKGKPHMVLALHAQGQSADEIKRLTGCPLKTVQRYVADFEAGRKDGDLKAFVGKDLGPVDLCRMHGAWYARFGNYLNEK